MTAFNSYSTGTIAIAANATVVIGVGTAWGGINAKPGDDLVVAGHTVVVIDVTDPTHLVIDAWPYTAVTAGTSYKIIWRSPLRYVGGQAMADVDTLIQTLTNGIFPTINGGTAASSTLTFQSTSGSGTTDAIIFKTGSQVERLRIDSVGEITETNDAAGAAGATFSMYQNSASPAVADFNALLKFYGNNSVALKTQYAELTSQILQTTSAAEYGCITGQVKVNGVLSNSLLGGAQTFVLGYCNPASSNFEYVFRGVTGKTCYMYLESFDPGLVGPSYNVWHNSPSPAANDIAGAFVVDGQNTAPAYQNYSRIDTVITNPASGSVAADMRFSLVGIECARLDSGGHLSLSGFANVFGARLEIASDPTSISHQSMIAIGANTAGPAIFLMKTRATTPSVQTIAAAQDQAGAVIWRVSDGVAFRNVAAIQAFVDGGIAAGDTPGRLELATTNDGTTTIGRRLLLDALGNVVVNNAAIATNAANGFLYVPSCAGTPTGTPTTYAGMAPIVVNTTNNKLYFYSTGAWRDAGP